jgi:hypothetical protein
MSCRKVSSLPNRRQFGSTNCHDEKLPLLGRRRRRIPFGRGSAGVAVLVVLLAALMVEPALSQRLTGSMTGRVLDWTGDPVRDAEVVITSPALITRELTTKTNERGDFRFPNLEPGVYEAKARLAGFGTMTRQNVRVSVGATTELTLELQPEMGEALVVTAEPPTVDTVATRTAVNFTRDLLENIPSLRDIATVFNFAPAVTGNSARGSTLRGNAYQSDGVDITDPTVGTQLVGFNYDTLDEIQVETGGHAAEYGQVSGALVNVVTKSGGNAFSGEANIYFQNGELTSTNGQDITSRFPELKSGELLRRIDTQGQLGGPIVLNRVWFFGAYRYLDRNTTVVGFNDASGDPLPTNQNEQFALAKITAQLNPNHRLVGGLHWDSLSLDNRGAGALTPPESTRTQDGANWVPNLEWTGIFTQTTFAQARFTAVDNHFDLIPKNDLPACENLDTGFLGCSAGIEDLNERKRRQLIGSLSHYREMGGTHDFKFGFEYQDSDDSRDFTANQGVYNLTLNNAAGVAVPYLGVTYQDPPTKEAINRLSLYAQDSWGIHDRLTLNLGVRLDRSEGWFPEQQLASGGTQPEMRDIISQTDISPRIGVAYGVGGLGRGVIRASYSRYVHSLITQYFSSVNGNAISGQIRAACVGALGFLCRPGDGALSSLVLSEFGAGNTLLDEGLELPKSNEYAVGFEFALVPSLSIGVNYVRKNEFDLPEDIDTRNFVAHTARDPGDTERDEAGNVVSASPPQAFTVYDVDLNSPTQYVITNPELAERDYQGVELILNKRMSNQWQLHGSFVISKSSGFVGTEFGDSSSISPLFDTPNTLINAEGRLGLNRTYQLKLLGTYRFPHGISFSGYYRWLSGRPYNRTVLFTAYDSNGDGINDRPFEGGSILINAEPRGSRTLDSLHLTDVRVEKEFGLGQGRLGVILDVFNLFNIDTVTSKRTRSTRAGSFGAPLSFNGPREIRLAARFIF